MKRGFTIVELMVVVVVLGAISTLTTLAYSAYRAKSQHAQVQSLASLVKSAAEKYYQKNYEYPAGNVLNSNDTCTGPSSYSSVKSILGIEEDVVNQNRAKLIPIGGRANPPSGISGRGGCETVNRNNVYYYTKESTDALGQSYTYRFEGSCEYTIKSGATGSTAFLLAYWNAEDDYWHVSASDNGEVSTSSNSTCPLRQV